MEKAFRTIEDNKMFQPGCVVGVACSGGSDSMALLHFLNTNREKLDIEVVAIHVDHGTRANDVRDALFVADYCKENRIRFHKFKVECKVLARKKKLTIEEACREGRYGIFKSLKDRGIVDVMAIAHHQSDQAETVLLHILRGSGLSGASGMSYVRDNYYVRPFLDVSKQEIMAYVYENDIPFVYIDGDITNGDLDGDVEITDADATYLLMYTFFPEDYPLNGKKCDFNDDGAVTDTDAVYLLMYTFFPDDYPIH